MDTIPVDTGSFSLYQIQKVRAVSAVPVPGRYYALVHAGGDEPFVDLGGVFRGHDERFQHVILLRLRPWFTQNPVGHLRHLPAVVLLRVGDGQLDIRLRGAYLLSWCLDRCYQ